ncbi:hypothetical protein K32_31180 [Kaistia sp. 32K]|uniref:hypothetical protein n=1 Tax=Kaistia sp. 32K TaxID=2795690 RepID=UPI001916A18A|nr:hypothetical protein [Kaistia sp. 32K]BCP54501.1 hypothetical protein K32_31180 [Kaistia sp. 32K]
MSALNILALAAIISAFAFFMITLAWAERQTRSLHASQQPAEARASVQAARPQRA